MQWDIIPQVSNDLIARVVPGSATLFLGYCVFTGPAKAIDSMLQVAPQEGARRFPSLFLWLVLSYVVGRLLAEVWDVVSRTAQLCRNRLRGEAKKMARQERSGGGDAARREPPLIEAQESWGERLSEYNELATLRNAREILPAQGDMALPDRYVLHDHLRLCAPSDAFRLLKIHAEEKMLKSLVVGLTILLVVGFWYWHWTAGMTSDRWLLSLALLVSTVCSWLGARRSNRHHLVAIQRAWLLHNYSFRAGKKTSAGLSHA